MVYQVDSDCDDTGGFVVDTGGNLTASSIKVIGGAVSLSGELMAAGSTIEFSEVCKTESKTSNTLGGVKLK